MASASICHLASIHTRVFHLPLPAHAGFCARRRVSHALEMDDLHTFNPTINGTGSRSLRRLSLQFCSMSVRTGCTEYTIDGCWGEHDSGRTKIDDWTRN